jgi:tetratricopeptide (TPR) repeat protein
MFFRRRETLARETFRKALAASLKDDDLDAAIAACTKGIETGPEVAEAYRWRAYCYWRAREAERAIADCTEAIRLNPNLADAYEIRAHAHELQGRYDEAIADYTEYMRLKPTGFDGPYFRGNAYAKKGDDDKALADFTAAIQVFPDFPILYWARGSAYRRKGESAKADANDKWGSDIFQFSLRLPHASFWNDEAQAVAALSALSPEQWGAGSIDIFAEPSPLHCWQTTFCNQPQNDETPPPTSEQE